MFTSIALLIFIFVFKPTFGVNILFVEWIFFKWLYWVSVYVPDCLIFGKRERHSGERRKRGVNSLALFAKWFKEFCYSGLWMGHIYTSDSFISLNQELKLCGVYNYNHTALPSISHIGTKVSIPLPLTRCLSSVGLPFCLTVLLTTDTTLSHWCVLGHHLISVFRLLPKFFLFPVVHSKLWLFDCVK